jgi:hypothetical protein
VVGIHEFKNQLRYFLVLLMSKYRFLDKVSFGEFPENRKVIVSLVSFPTGLGRRERILTWGRFSISSFPVRVVSFCFVSVSILFSILAE